MSLFRKLFGGKKTGSTVKDSSAGKVQNERISELIATLEPDIQTDMDTDIAGRSSKAAIELSKFGESAVEQLIQALSRSSYAHLALSFIGCERAFQSLCRELQTGNWRRVEAAAKALGRIGDPRALEFLRPHTATKIAEVHRAVTTAIGDIERAQVGKERNTGADKIQLRGDNQSGMADVESEITGMIKDFVSPNGRTHGSQLSNAVKRIGAPAIPVLKKLLEGDLNGEVGYAVVLALNGASEEINDQVLPLIALAFTSLYPAVRWYAADYLRWHPSSAGNEMSRKQLQRETDKRTRDHLMSVLEQK